MASDFKLQNNIGSELSILHNDNTPRKALTTNDFTYKRNTVEELTSLIPVGATLTDYDKEVCIVTDTARGGIFVYDSSKSDVKDGGVVFNGWVRQYDGDINAKWFGAVGNGINDDTSAIQLAIDYCIRYKKSSTTFLPTGNYRTTDTIHLGYDAYSGLTLIGSGSMYKGEATPGTTIIADFIDRPAIAISGARRTKVKALTIIGKNKQYVYDKGLGLAGSLVDDRIIENWIDPNYSSMSNGRYNPYAGIAVDPYIGSRPLESYPDVNYPSWTGITTQYGKAPSSQFYFDDVAIYGFIVGIVLQPANYDANGDYMFINNCALVGNVYGYSCGNSQARQLGISNTLITGNHIAFTNIAHGIQRGKIAGVLNNVNLDCNTIIFKIDTSRGTLLVNSAYSENTHIILLDELPSSNKNPITFSNCEFSIPKTTERYRGKAKYDIIQESGTTILDNCIVRFGEEKPELESIPALSCSKGTTLITNNCKLGTNYFQAVSSSQAVCMNMLQNSILPYSRDNSLESNFFKGYNVDTLSTIETFLYSKLISENTSRSITFPRMLNRASNTLSKKYSIVEPFYYINTSSWTNVSVNGLKTTVDIGTSDIGRIRYRLDLGDIIQYGDSYHYVYARVGSVITFVALNDYEYNGVQNNPIPSVPSGDVVCFHSRKYTVPSGREYFISFTAGSDTASIRRASDGYIGGLDADFAIGDRLFETEEILGVFASSDNQKILSVDTVNGTITFEHTARRSVSDAIIFIMSRTFNS